MRFFRYSLLLYNALSAIGIFLLVIAGFFYAILILSIPLYATYRAFTDKDPVIRKRYTFSAIASAITFFLIGILALMISKGIQKDREEQRLQQLQKVYQHHKLLAVMILVDKQHIILCTRFVKL